jgi:flagellar motor protein MotB
MFNSAEKMFESHAIANAVARLYCTARMYPWCSSLPVVASYPGLRFNVEGHTDSTGGVATNNELSMQRAITVRDYLIGQGVPASSIDVAGLGSSAPLGDNTTADGRTRNRRVETVLSGGLIASR